MPVWAPSAVPDRAPLAHGRAREDHRPSPRSDTPHHLGGRRLRPSLLLPIGVDRPEVDARHGVDRCRQSAEVLQSCGCDHRDRGADREPAARRSRTADNNLVARATSRPPGAAPLITRQRGRAGGARPYINVVN